jgi:hypothetical protein
MPSFAVLRCDVDFQDVEKAENVDFLLLHPV